VKPRIILVGVLRIHVNRSRFNEAEAVKPRIICLATVIPLTPSDRFNEAEAVKPRIIVVYEIVKKGLLKASMRPRL